MESVKLVLNINTPNYFQTKRKLETPFATIAAKKIKLSVGKSFRPSSKISKLKTRSAINSINNSSFQCQKGNSDTFSSGQNPCNKKTRKSKVSFNSSVEVFPNDSTKKGAFNRHGSLPENLSNKSVDAPQDKPAPKSGPTKPVISSLFKKNPEIPSLPQTEVITLTAGVFSQNTFKELDIAPQIISNVEKCGFTTMTKVQHLGIPPILEGKDALIKSQTGSGKTLAYVLPIIHKLMTRKPKVERQHGTYALIVVPTRELAIQTYQWLEKLCKSCVWVVPGYLIGGEKKKAEKARLRRGINILVATPGRLTDHIFNTMCLGLLRVEFLVFDEADRMLEMGYEKSITGIIKSLDEKSNGDSKRQTIMLSATLTTAVEKLAGISLTSPVVIDVTIGDRSDLSALTGDAFVTPQNLKNFFILVPAKLRLVTLSAFIVEKCRFSADKKMLIFMTTQDMVDYHTSLFSLILSRFGERKKQVEKDEMQERAAKVLSGIEDGGDNDAEDYEDEDMDEVNENDIHYFKLHGSMTQPERTAVFKSFREASAGVLLCTDVASRGLDLPKVNWIVQYTPAFDASDYVHRVGRTARAECKGSALVFVNPNEATYVTMLEKHGIVFEEVKMEVVLQSLTAPSLYNKEIENVPRSMEIAATRLQDEFENAVASDRDMHDMANKGYISFIRSYAAIPRDAREYFSFRLLHLGHYAKSFGLRETPAVIGAARNKGFHKREKNLPGDRFGKNWKTEPEYEKSLFQKRTIISEFDSGLEGFDKLRKEKKKVTKQKKIINNKGMKRNIVRKGVNYKGKR